MSHTVRAATAALLTLACPVFAQPSTPGAAAPAVSKPPVQTAAAPADTLRIISDFNSPPFSYRDGMKRVGVDIDLAEAVAKEMGRRVEWIPMNFDVKAYASALNRGSADAAIASITITPERETLFSFTKPYARMGLAMAIRSDIDWRHSWFTSGLEDWRIAVMRGTTAEKWAKKNLEGKLAYYSSLDRMISVLKSSPKPTRSGRGGTCILHDEVPLRWALSNYSYRYEIVETGMETQKYGIAVRQGNTALLESLNTALDRLRESREIRALKEKWRTRAQGLAFFSED